LGEASEKNEAASLLKAKDRARQGARNEAARLLKTQRLLKFV
jgi:hypothetical protein